MKHRPLFILFAALAFGFSLGFSAAEKPRLVVLTDIGGDPDDQMSMVRLMTYANQIDIEGLVATHVGGRVNPEQIQRIVAAYGKVRDNLELHESRYPKAEYLQERIGERFTGTVSGLTNWGIYVELAENKCEGMIGLRDLPGDQFKFDDQRYLVRGASSGRVIRLGDELDVVVRAVDMDRRTVALALAPPVKVKRG